MKIIIDALSRANRPVLSYQNYRNLKNYKPVEAERIEVELMALGGRRSLPHRTFKPKYSFFLLARNVMGGRGIHGVVNDALLPYGIMDGEVQLSSLSSFLSDKSER